MYHNLQPLCLASGSPRRRDLLSRLGLQFSVVPAAIPEEVGAGELPDSFARRLALAKAEAGASAGWTLAADTIVVMEEHILGKPENRERAFAMLEFLSGRCHQVITAVALHHAGRGLSYVFQDTTAVEFIPLSERLIKAYLATGEADDKAGAYAFQGLGAAFIRRISGCPTTVIGLPLPATLKLLLQQGIIAVVH
ncbi:MAG: septum formation protein Maf [Deltaproteobacteria bacterium]|nr:septum formation protein Maf [Deltaproteobacteria bacterium]